MKTSELSADQKHLVEYFLVNRTPQGMVLDRQSDRKTVSVAAAGFGCYAWAVAALNKIINKAEALTWINEALDQVEKTTPEKNRGWLYHFTTPEGEPKHNKEVSPVDTALFYLGARKAATTLRDRKTVKRIEEMVGRIDVDWMMTDDKRFFRLGLTWDSQTPKYFRHRWDEYCEGVLIYKLFGRPFQPRRTVFDLPLFVYYFPLCFYHDPEMVENLEKAVSWQLDRYDACGVTACDGPDGYAVNDPNILSPLAVWAASRWSKKAKDYLPQMRHKRTTPSYHRHTKWVSKDRIGIDEGSTLMAVTSVHGGAK